MDDKKRIQNNAIEMQIIRDISSARAKVLKMECDNTEELPDDCTLSVKQVHQILPFFDLFRSIYAGNAEGVERQVSGQNNCTYYDGMMDDYQKIMCGLMAGQYKEEDVISLHAKLKDFVRKRKKQPARILYIADCHFYHNRLCKEMDKRGFSGFEKMNEHMVSQWNGKVTQKDDVYILGDFSIAKSDATMKILNRLNGKLHLIIGNHDRYLDDKHFDRSFFRSIEHYAEIRDSGRTVILSHYPVFCYKGQYRLDKDGRPLTYMLYGHVHNTHDEKLIDRFIMETRSTLARSRHHDHPVPIPCSMINCFCMFSDYQPMTLDEWIKTDRKRRMRMDWTICPKEME